MSPDPSSINERRTTVALVSGAALAVLAWSTVALQLWLSIRLSLAHGKSIGDGILEYLGYFTILTNIFVALVLAVPLLAPSSPLGRVLARAQVRACATASIVLVSIGYHILLRNVWTPGSLSWLAVVLLHYGVPSLFLLYWLLVLPKQRLAWWSPLAWCLYPIAYFAYTLLRGVILNTYPYSFFDVNKLGYERSLQNALGLLLLFIIIGAVLVATSNVVVLRKGALAFDTDP